MLLKDFSTNIVLTSQNNEAFLNFRYDASEYYIVPIPNPSIGHNYLYVNGIDINSYRDACVNYCLELNSTNNIASFHLFTFNPSNFNINLSFKAYDTNEFLTYQQEDVSIFGRPFIINNYKVNNFDTTNIQEDNITSYLLMRTNPKLSGNIKLVVDSNNKIYLDTFQVTNALSNKEFRKIEVSPGPAIDVNDFGDHYEIKVSKIFGKGVLPKDDLFKINELEDFDISSPKRNYEDQYDFTYCYGARLLKEELYDNSYAILAPLWINKKLPDYFVIFRLGGSYNPETYIDENDTTFFKKFLKDSSIVKSWSLKENSPIGILLNRYLEEINKNQAPVFLSLDENVNVNQNPNSWIGIDVDSGVIAPKNYYINELINIQDNYTELNNYISTKFSALNSICPNLINLEFTFDDNIPEDYSMNRYFGLYLSQNELYKVFYYQDNPADASVIIKSLDNNIINDFFSSKIFSANKDISINYKNRIFTLIDNDDNVNRIYNANEINGEVSTNLSNYINKTDKNIFSVDAELLPIKSFITFTINNKLKQGEHLRVINKTKNKIWEIYGLDSSLLTPGTNWCYNSITPIQDLSLNRIEYGYLYNWYVGKDSSVANIEWRVPSRSDFETLITYTGLAGGGKLKSIDSTYWNSPNTGATNEFYFNAKGGGIRLYTTGEYLFQKYSMSLWSASEGLTATQGWGVTLTYNTWDIGGAGNAIKKSGSSLRLIKNNTTLSPGESSIYIGNDGKTYNTICIGTQEWLAENLYETKYRNGDDIPEVTDPDAWINLSTGARCVYDNNENNAFIIIYYEGYNGYPELVRTAFSTEGSLENQVNAIYDGFNSFKNFEYCPFNTYKNTSNTISLVLNEFAEYGDDYVFQRLTSQTRSNYNDSTSSFKGTASYNDLSFFTVYNASENDYETISYDASYGPISFELFGDRKSIMVDFMNITNNYLYSIDGSCYLFKDIKETRSLFKDFVLYQSNSGWYKLLQEFDVSTNVNKESFNYVLDPTKDNKNLLIKTSSYIKLVNNKKFNAYSVYPISISLMGINPVKDFDFTVYDKNLGYKSKYWYKRDNDNDTYEITLDPSTSLIINDRFSLSITSGKGRIATKNKSISYNVTSGEFPFNTFDSSITIYTSTTTTIKHNILDGTQNYTSYKNSINEEDISIYYYDSNRTKLKYNLTSPYIVKWVGQGNDCRNNEFRLLLNNSWLDNSNSNYIPSVRYYTSEISYPVFKYLSPGEREWQDYIYYDINDTVVCNEDNVISYVKLKELIFKQPNNDIFSKIIYNNNTDKSKTRSSLVYYDKIENSLKTIFLGLKLKLTLNGLNKTIIDISKYDKYRFAFISTPSRNLTSNYPIELIINENTETILMIWYQGNDILHYNKRYSNTSPGKAILHRSRYTTNKSYLGFNTLNTDSSGGYSFIKAPYNVNNSIYTTRANNVYDIKQDYSEGESSKFSEFIYSYNSSLGYIFNAFDINTVNYSIFSYDKSYNNFSNKFSYIPSISVDTYGKNVINLGYLYNNNENLYKNNTCNYNTLETLLGYGNNVMYYIIKEDSILNNYSFVTYPMLISIESPLYYNNIYTYNGYYIPKFNNILEFDSNEDNTILSTTKKDFVLANTNLTSYNNISQLWYNKVALLSTSASDNIRYKDFNPFSSQWDDNYYYLEDINSAVPGYQATLEKPSFFGSKLLKLPKNLTFEFTDWNINSITSISYLPNISKIQLSIHMKNTIFDKFIKNNNFIKNWGNLPLSNSLLDNDPIIKAYINKTIIPYYDYDLKDINVELYTKSKIIPNAEYQLVNGTNFEKIVANNTYYVIILDYNDYINFDYYVKLTLREK